jgi:tRNA A37 methylthiotransferase MiaB
MLQLTMPHVAYVKIADGCNNCCSYCIIPRLRGKLRSRPAADVLAEISSLAANGVKEIIIVAQDVTAFGMDRPESGETLAGLLTQIENIDGDFKVRLLYTHPAHYTDGKIEVIDFIRDKHLDFCRGNVVKYICRAGKKSKETELEDLKKAMKYCQFAIEELEGRNGD